MTNSSDSTRVRVTRDDVAGDDDYSPVRSVARAIDILMALTAGPQSLRTLCETTGLSKATGHRLLAALSHRLLAVQDEEYGFYSLGPGCFRLADALGRGLGGLAPVSQKILIRLRDEMSETVTLHIRVGFQRTCVQEVPSTDPLRYVAGVGTSMPIHVGSAGKVLLAFMDNETLEPVLQGLRLDSFTDRTITDLDELRAELETVREQGWAQSRGERVIGAAAISVPVFDEANGVVAALSVLGPDTRLTVAEVSAISQRVISAAREISERLQTSSDIGDAGAMTA